MSAQLASPLVEVDASGVKKQDDTVPLKNSDATGKKAASLGVPSAYKTCQDATTTATPPPSPADGKEIGSTTSIPASTAVPIPPPPPTSEDLARQLPTVVNEIADDERWFNVDLNTCTSAKIHHLDWENSTGFVASSEGSEGVLFIHFQDNSVVTVKGSSTAAADMFALDLAAKANIAVPKYRILRCGVDEEFKVLSDRLTKLDERNHPLRRNKHARAFEHPVVTIMEFVSKGKVLHDINPKVFGGGKLSHEGITILRETALCTVFDMVINNWDRIPLLWDNTGNPDNILFTRLKRKHDGEIHPVAIDNTITSIDPATFENNFLEYVDKIRCVINEICVHVKMAPIFQDVRQSFSQTSSDTHKPTLDSFLKFFKSATHHDIVKEKGDVALDAILVGMIEGIVAFSKVSHDELTEMRSRIEDVINACLRDHPGMTADSLAMYKVNIDFLDAVLKVMREATPALQPELQKLNARLNS